jgi:hypothetical protein
LNPMRQKKQVSLYPKGTTRNTPDSGSVDGAMFDMLNARFKDAAWRGTGQKQRETKIARHIYPINYIYRHPALPTDDYLVYNPSHHSIDKVTAHATDTITSQVFALQVDETFDRLGHLNNVLLVFTSINKYLLYWDTDNSVYVDLTFLPVPIVNIADGTEFEAHEQNAYGPLMSSVDMITTTGYTEAQNWNETYRRGVMGNYFLSKSEMRDDGYIEGFILVRLAYRLFDGSYIKHTQPFLHHIAYHPTKEPILKVMDKQVAWPFTPGIEQLMYAKPAVYYNFFSTGNFTLPDQAAMGMVESLDIFSTEPIDTYDIDQEIIKWRYVGPDPIIADMSIYNPVFNTNSLNKIAEDGQYYKVHTIPIKDIIAKAEHLDLSGEYYYAKAGVVLPDYSKSLVTNDILPPDNFSHLKTTSGCSYQYNSRVHMGNIFSTFPALFNNIYHSYMLGKLPPYNGYSQVYGMLPDPTITTKYLGDYIFPDMLGSADYIIYQQVWIRTDEGRKVITSEIPKSYVETLDAQHIPIAFRYYGHSYVDGMITKTALILNPILSYPDYRAYKIRLYYTISGAKSWLGDYDLKPNTATNTGYYINTLVTDDDSTGNFYPIIIPLPDDPYSTTAMPTDSPVDNAIINDTNRLQVSEQSNPFLYPAMNSYRVGNPDTTILDITTAQEQVSETLFGQYPLYVFSDNGISALQQGTGLVLYANIHQFSNDVLLHRGSWCAIPGGAIVFATHFGIKVLTGRATQDISEAMFGVLDSSDQVSHLPLLTDKLSDNKISQLSLAMVGNDQHSFANFLLQPLIIGYDYFNNEIILAPKHDQSILPPVNETPLEYTYNFCLKSNYWYRNWSSYVGFLPHEGGWKGVIGRYTVSEDIEVDNEQQLIFCDLNKEIVPSHWDDSREESIYLHSRPFIAESVGYKHLEQVLIGLSIPENSRFTSFLLYGSNDQDTWYCISAIDVHVSPISRINVPRAVGNWKYFTYVMILPRDNVNLAFIQSIFTYPFTNKLR